ncbi:MAG: type II secretion system F family protein [Syntrophomonadaceae bacterium]|nr:type II secretion system F family protein [Syntrophomonadaceae bacterium]
MNYFYYLVRDREGSVHKGGSWAKNREEAVMELIGQGYWVLDISPRGRWLKELNLDFRIGRPVGRNELTWFFRQLSMLVEAGVPLMEALESLREQVSNRTLKEAVGRVVRELRRGESLANAFMKQERVIPLIAARMIGSGEAGGTLGNALQRVSLYLEREQEFIRKAKSGITYPLLLAGFAVGVMLFLTVFVVPRLVRVFEFDMANLPLLTRAILGVAAGIEMWMGPAAILILALGLFIKWYRKTPSGRNRTDRLLMSLPLAGSFIRRLGITRFLYNMGILVQTGLSITETLRVCEQAADNTVLAAVIREVYHNVCRGQSIAESLKVSGLFAPPIIQMVAVGEKTGRLDESLLRVSGYYDAEIEHLIQTGLSLLEPALVIIMALVVGVIVSGCILPLLDMMNAF